MATSRRRSADLHVHAQPDQEAVARRAVVEQLHRVVGQHAPALGQHWERREAEGRISMDQWVAGLKEVTGLAAEWSAYASELRVPVDAGGVDWRRFLRRYTPRVEGRQQQWAEQMRREVYELLTKEVCVRACVGGNRERWMGKGNGGQRRGPPHPAHHVTGVAGSPRMTGAREQGPQGPWAPLSRPLPTPPHPLRSLTCDI